MSDSSTRTRDSENPTAAAVETEAEETAAETSSKDVVAEAAAPEDSAASAEESAAGEPAAEDAAADEAVAEEAVEAAPGEVVEAKAQAEKESQTEPETDEAVEAVAATPGAEAEESSTAGETAETETPVEAKAASDSDDAASAGETSETDEEEGDPVADAEIERLTAAKESQEILQGKVIGWNKGGYHVAIGKTAAFCPVSQIEIGNPRSPKKYLDKTFPFHVIEIQRGGRRVVVSRASAIAAERKAAAEKVREQLEVGAVLEGRVSNLTDFGAFVDLGGKIEGLVHVSEISRQRVEHAKEKVHVGQKVKVQVIKIEKGGKRISLSMKRLEDDPWEGVKERYTSGQELEGPIVRKAEFGLFVEVEPGLEGLVHTSRLPLGMSLESEELAEGTPVHVWVQEIDRKRRRMSLSMRPVAEGDPWKNVGERYPEGDMVEGTVERLADFGAFIELEPGLTGLLPFSVLGGVSHPKRQFQVGKPVEVKVLAIDTDKKRISLGTEQSRAEGNRQDFKEYVKSSKPAKSGMNTLAAAFEKLKDQLPQQQ